MIDWLIGSEDSRTASLSILFFFFYQLDTFLHYVNAETGITISNNLMTTKLFYNQGMFGLYEVIKSKKTWKFLSL